MGKKYKVKIATPFVGANGTRISEFALKKAVEDFNGNDTRLGFFGQNKIVTDLSSIALKVDCLDLSDNGELVAEIEASPTVYGNILTDMIDGGHSPEFYLSGYFEKDQDSDFIKNFVINSINVCCGNE